MSSMKEQIQQGMVPQNNLDHAKHSNGKCKTSFLYSKLKLGCFKANNTSPYHWDPTVSAYNLMTLLSVRDVDLAGLSSRTHG